MLSNNALNKVPSSIRLDHLLARRGASSHSDLGAKLE